MQQDELIQKLFDKFDEHTVILTKLNVSINGNGVKGLHQRVSDLEAGESRRNIVVGVCSGLALFVGWISQFFKGS